MKRFFWFLLLGVVATIGASAQTATITGPASPVNLVSGTVTTTGTVTPTSSVAVTVTNSATSVVVVNSGAATVSGTNWSFAWTPTAVGDYVIRAVPAQIIGNTAVSATTTLTINSIAPVVTLTVAGGATSIPAGAARYLAATATDDGAITKVEFYLDGALLGTVTSPASGSVYSLAFTAPSTTGTHQLVARAYDNAGNFANSATATIEVTTPVGSAPTVAIVAPVTGAFLPAGIATTITGTVSDSDGTISSVVVFMNGFSLGNATVTSGTWSLVWTPSTQGAFSLTAIASDDRGNAVLSSAVVANITDNTSPAVVISVSPGAATLPAGATRYLNAAVTPAAGRAVVRVEYFINGTKIGEKTAASSATTNGTTGLTTGNFAFKYTAPTTNGTYILDVRATDNTGLSRDAQSALAVVSAIGSAPTVSLISPANGASVLPGTALNLAASALATGGTISSVAFYQNGGLVGTVTASPYTFPFTPPSPGSYALEAIATDDRGNTTVSNTITITAAFAAPTIVISAPTGTSNNPTRATPGVPLNISAGVQASTGASITLVEYFLGGVLIGSKTPPATSTNTTTGVSTYTFAWTPTTAQIGAAQQITARVTDTNSLQTTSSAVYVTVATTSGSAPVITGVAANPVPAAGLQTLSTVNLVATANSPVAGGSISSVEFFLNDLSAGLAVREGTSNLWRLVYNFAAFDFSVLIADTTTGRYSVPLFAIARDNSGNQTASTTTTLLFTPSQSSPPTASVLATTTTTFALGGTFSIAPNFADSDGSVASLQLYVNGVATGAAVANPVVGVSTLNFAPTAAGSYRLFFAAIDDTGNSAFSAVNAAQLTTITVTANTAPATVLTRPTDDSTVTNTGAPVFLEATATTANAATTPTLNFVATAASSGAQTTITGTRVTTVGTLSTFRAVFTPTVADTFTIKATGIVGTGTGQVTTDSAQSRRVTVNALVGIAPTITISVPTSVTSGSTANLVATATSSSGSIASVEFFVNRNSIGQAVRDQLNNTWRINASFIGLTPGAYEVVALARDSAGNISASPTSTTTVTAGTGTAPSITVFAAPTSIALGQSIVLTAAASSITGTVTNVTYFANATNLASRTTPPSPGQAGYQFTWTNAGVGTFNVYAVATDSNNNTSVSASIPVTVRRFSPLLDDDAFVLQTYVDISNNTAPNLILASSYSAQLTAGTLTRAQLVSTLTDDNGTGFSAPSNLLIAYYVLMGQWPTPTNYSTLITGFRNNLAGAVGNILASPEYIAKYPEHITPTAALLSNPASVIPATTFEQRLWSNAGLGSPSAAADVAFRNNPTATATLGRGYTVAGLTTAIAEFITNTNSTNLVLQNLAQAAALFYQLDKPPTTMTTDEIATRIAAIASQPSTTAQADVALKDILYTYRYVTILSSPTPLVVAPRSGAIFRVNALGAPPISYQWLFNGAPIANATNSILSLTNVDATKAGTYTVQVSTSNGVATSDPATLSLSSALTKLGNISTRGSTGAGGGQLLIAGFVVTGPANQTRQMLIRVVGPSLAGQGIPTGFLADPRLEVYGAGANPILTNDNWGTQTGGAAAVTAIQQATTRTGAFPLTNSSSADAVVLATLSPGNYTVQAKGQGTATGVVLIEVYDATTASNGTTPKPINVSTRGPVGTGLNTMIAGFVINGTVSRRVLIRGVGPTLASFGLGNAGLLADPQIELFDSANVSLRTNDNWASGDDAAIIAAAATAGGAFPLANGSKDAAMLVMLAPGAYTVQLTGVGNTTGLGLVEVYDVDP